MRIPIYLDYMATTPVDPRVTAKMLQYLHWEGDFGNPASRNHSYGLLAHEAINRARQQAASLINAAPEEIIWTSGATEANNLAIKGAALFYQRKGKHIITCKTEHKAVLDPCQYLASRGFEISYLTPRSNGIIDLEQLKNIIQDDTVLVSIMHVNNEIGVIQDIAAIAAIVKSSGALFHVDAAQSAGKIAIDVQRWQIDLLSMSAHKMYGPKGVGALYARRKPRVRLEPLLHGGGHEYGLRSGTLPTHQIVAMGEACHIAQENNEAENQRLAYLRNRLWEGIKDLSGIYLNGDWQQRIAGNLNVSFANVNNALLFSHLNDIAISPGSACTSAASEPSHVLLAIGRNEQLARSSIRFSLGRYTTEEEIDFTIAKIRQAVRLSLSIK